MRHLKAGKRLGVTTSHRRAMMRNLVTALLEHGQIQTTLVKAKQMRKDLDKMIGYGKRGNLHAKKQVLRFIKSKEAFQKLFDEYGPRFNDRNGGYSRIYRLGNRLGDNAQLALIQLLGEDEAIQAKAAASETLEEVKQEVSNKKESIVIETSE